MNSCVLWLLLIWMPNNAECICKKVGKKLRRPSLHAFIIHCGTKLAPIATPITLTDSYIRFLSKTQPYLSFMTWTPKSKANFYTLPKYTVLIQWWVVYAIQFFAEVHPVLLHCWTKHQKKSHCWALPNSNTLLR